MPTTIDRENAKQIRQPMDVRISMDVPEDVAITPSGYASSAKLADGVLDERGWPMRKLADLQGDGFPLDGTCVLYDPSTTASVDNGKLGVRGHVGQDVTVTVTGARRISTMTIFATAETVSYNDVTVDVGTGSVVIPVGETSITLTFAPSSADVRAEVGTTAPGAIFEITNETLISATVSLRSDLSLVDQTLPESELNVEVYNDADISDAVATIPKDTPITYSAGYPGDMSPERKFYLADQVTWADNVLSIHAVDAVHFLDRFTIVAPITNMDSSFILDAVLYALERAGVDAHDGDTPTGWGTATYRWILRENTNSRELIAFLNQCFNLTDDEGLLIDGSASLWAPLSFVYVDAGRPRIRTYNFVTGEYQISEDDCSNIKRNIEPAITQVRAEHARITNQNVTETSNWDSVVQQVGTATFAKNIGTSLTFDKYTAIWAIGLALGPNGDTDAAKKLLAEYGVLYGGLGVCPVVPTETTGGWCSYAPEINDPYYVGAKLAIGSIPQEEFLDYPAGATKKYSSFVPWSQRYDKWELEGGGRTIVNAARMWAALTNAKIMSSDTASIDLDIYGLAYNLENQVKTYNHGSAGQTYEYPELPIIGQIAATKANDTVMEIYPSKMLAAPMYRSNVTGSFTWKGDPRIQPRDYFTFTRLDGAEEECTFETITLHHEGGGTYAEVTYRKGRI